MTCLVTIKFNDGTTEERMHSGNNFLNVIDDFTKWHKDFFDEGYSFFEIGDEITFQVIEN